MSWLLVQGLATLAFGFLLIAMISLFSSKSERIDLEDMLEPNASLPSIGTDEEISKKIDNGSTASHSIATSTSPGPTMTTTDHDDAVVPATTVLIVPAEVLHSRQEGTNITSFTNLIIHIGPVKTGSSSIQCNLQANPYLRMSSYRYMGRKERQCAPYPKGLRQQNMRLINLQAFYNQYVRRGWLENEVPDHQKYVQDFKDGMVERHNDGIHTILSAEEFCIILPKSEEDKKYLENRWKEFARLLNHVKEQNISFRVFYRHYFDWAVSEYTFYELWKKPKSFQDQELLSIVDAERMHTVGGCNPFTSWAYIKSQLPLFNRTTVDVFNFHGEGDLAQRFICSLPNADEACEGSKKIKLDVSRPTDVDKLHADRIATGAWKQEMYVQEKIQEYVTIEKNMTFSDLPLDCLDEHKLAFLLETSIQVGKEMLGDAHDVESMKKMFEGHIRRKKFCSVNVKAVLLDSSWQQFFKNHALFG